MSFGNMIYPRVAGLFTVERTLLKLVNRVHLAMASFSTGFYYRSFERIEEQNEGCPLSNKYETSVVSGQSKSTWVSTSESLNHNRHMVTLR